jgi:hypothetical protein
VELVLDADAVSDLVGQPSIATLVVDRHRDGTARFVVSADAHAPSGNGHAASCAALAARLDLVPDATLAAALDLGAVLVTRDATLTTQASAGGIEVWSSAALVVHLVATS